jgi:hypothetical protein
MTGVMPTEVIFTAFPTNDGDCLRSPAAQVANVYLR